MAETSNSSTKTQQLDDETIKKLVENAIKAKEKAYCPYSKFPVGCSILTKCGKFFNGCNVENSSIGLTICAERVTAGNAVANGFKEFKAIAVSTNLDTFVSCCGACRQFLIEFGLDYDVYMVNKMGDWKTISMSELVPIPFLPATMNKYSELVK